MCHSLLNYQTSERNDIGLETRKPKLEKKEDKSTKLGIGLFLRVFGFHALFSGFQIANFFEISEEIERRQRRRRRGYRSQCQHARTAAAWSIPPASTAPRPAQRPVRPDHSGRRGHGRARFHFETSWRDLSDGVPPLRFRPPLACIFRSFVSIRRRRPGAAWNHPT